MRGDECPYTCEAFRRLVTGEAHDGDGHALSLKDTLVHDVHPGILIGGGMFPRVAGHEKDKPGVIKHSAFGPPFLAENFELEFEEGSVAFRTHEAKETCGTEFFIFLDDEDSFNAQERNEARSRRDAGCRLPCAYLTYFR